MDILWTLPQSTEIGGLKYEMVTDYRDIFDILAVMQADEDREQTVITSLALFYKDFERLPISDYGEAWEYLKLFIDCGEQYQGGPQPKVVDWTQDAGIIAAEINKVAHCEIRTVPYMHWFTFVGYYHGIGEGQLSTLVSIRDKRARGKKLEKWEREFYQNNKSRVDFKKSYTEEEKEEIERIKKLLGE